MTDFLKKERSFVVPGEEIVKSIQYLPGKNCFREGDSIYAKRLGIVSISGRVVSVIPLNIPYMPKVGDMVIARVSDIQFNGWILDINSPYTAFLPLSGVREYIDLTKTDISKIYNVNDFIYTKISLVSQSDVVYASMQDVKCKKLRGGRIFKINPAKIPRLIGKQGSMINLIKRKTDCRILIGQNGVIWISGDRIDDVIKAINLIEKEPYAEGLTDRISELLDEVKK